MAWLVKRCYFSGLGVLTGMCLYFRLAEDMDPRASEIQREHVIENCCGADSRNTRWQKLEAYQEIQDERRASCRAAHPGLNGLVC